MKRTFDIMLSFVGLVVFFPLFILVALLIKLDSPGMIFFIQDRMGRGFRPFSIYKFRTMIQNAPESGGRITIAGDRRITRMGRFLRKSKIDELPQLMNVLKGDMSLVGPRPEVCEFVELFHSDYDEILQVRPGITDLASLKYHDESAILGQSARPDEDYVKRILPDKITLAKEYIRRSSLWFDLTVICRTVLKIFDYRLSH